MSLNIHSFIHNIDIFFNVNEVLPKNIFKSVLEQIAGQLAMSWAEAVLYNTWKLRTYWMLKNSYCLSCLIPRQYRSKIATFRYGVVPIRLETDRHENLLLKQRFCPICEDEVLGVWVFKNKLSII